MVLAAAANFPRALRCQKPIPFHNLRRERVRLDGVSLDRRNRLRGFRLAVSLACPFFAANARKGSIVS
jgi:hypothetical protein